jgi:hypothetical protein
VGSGDDDLTSGTNQLEEKLRVFESDARVQSKEDNRVSLNDSIDGSLVIDRCDACVYECLFVCMSVCVYGCLCVWVFVCMSVCELDAVLSWGMGGEGF